MRRRGRLGWLASIRSRPLVAAIGVSALSLVLIGAIVVSRTSLRAGTVATRTTSTPPGRIPFPAPYSPSGNPASPPYGNPASGPYPLPASPPFPPQANPASPSGVYPPFYPPASYRSDVSTRALDCRLPVYAGPPGSGGFIVFPGGTFIADPTSSVALPTPSPGGATAPPAPGYGPGYPGLSYDRQYSRWVPVSTNWVSPDGSHYAYISDAIYAVNVASGTQTELREGRTWTIAGVQNDGVYAGDQNVGGLWFLPFSGAPRQITTSGYWQASTSAAAYGTATSAVPQGASNTILRLDVKTGKTTEWFTHPDTLSSVAGLDAQGNPVIYVRWLNGSGSEIWIVTGPDTGTAIAGFASGGLSSYGGFNAFGTPVADSHGVWFTGNWAGGYGSNASGFAIYVPGSGMYWMSSLGGQLAGGCY